MDSLLIDFASLGLPGAFLALTVWYTRRYDHATERTVKLIAEDRDRWLARAVEWENLYFSCKAMLDRQNEGNER